MTLIETVTAAFLDACALALLSTALVFSASSAAERQRLIGRAATELQVESLLRSWIEYGGPIRISRASARLLQMRSDLDGDGFIDLHSKEQLTLTLEPQTTAADDSMAASGHQLMVLRHRIGRQTYTVARGLPARSSFRYLDMHGRATSGSDSPAIVSVPLPTGPVLLGIRERHAT